MPQISQSFIKCMLLDLMNTVQQRCVCTCGSTEQRALTNKLGLDSMAGLQPSTQAVLCRMYIKHFAHEQLKCLPFFCNLQAITTKTATRHIKAIPLLVSLHGEPGKLGFWPMRGGSLCYMGLQVFPGGTPSAEAAGNISASISPILQTKQTELSLVAAHILGTVQDHLA